jgi:MFS superfamily sulfate permease-like transporter
MTEHKHAVSGSWAFSRQDLMASLVVFLVALPLCMGIAIASGMPVAAGLVTGIIGGIVVGIIGGAPLQVSGPAAGLTVVCAEVVNRHGLPALAVVVVMAGTIQLVAGLARLGQWFRAVSPAVVHGMLAGIGVLILSSQLHVMVDDRPRQGGVANILSIPEAIRKGLPWPQRDEREIRQMRLSLLQDLGRLHERQTEIATHLSRLEDKLASQAGGHDEHLEPFIPLQKSLVTDVQSLTEKVKPDLERGLLGAESVGLLASFESAVASGDAALADLAGGSIAEALMSQRQAVAAMTDVLAGLKNHDWAAKLGLAAILLIIAWKNFAPGRLQFLPAPLLAVAVVTAVAWWLAVPVLYVEAPDRLTDGLTLPSVNVFKNVPLGELVWASVFMAIIASAETLLCATAVDRMHHGPRAKYDEELCAQGIGNMMCGLVGGLPMTGVIVRSAANVQAGAKSHWSAILHGLWLLIFVVFCAPLLRMIPTAALAGILVYTGFRLIDFRGLWHSWQHERVEAVIFVVTLVVIVVEDLLIGVATGFVLSAIKLLVRFTRLEVRVNAVQGSPAGDQTTVRIVGAATFLRLPILAKRLEEVPSEGEVHLNTDRLVYIDEACLDLIRDWIRQRESEGQNVEYDQRRLKMSSDEGPSGDEELAAPAKKSA